MDTVRRSIQRASALTASDLKKGISALATIGSTAPFVGLLGTVVGVITAFQGIAASGSGGIGAVSAGDFGSARRDGARAGRRDSGGVVLQLPDRPHRVLQRGDGQLLVGAGGLLHQEDRVTPANQDARRFSYVNGSWRRQGWSQIRHQRDAAR